MGLFDKKKTVNMKIGGMHCEKCAAKVEAALKALGKGSVDLKLGRASLVCPEKITADQIKASIEALGFTCEIL